MIVNTRILKAIMQRPEIFLIFIFTTNEWIDLRILGSLLMDSFQNVNDYSSYCGSSEEVTVPKNKQWPRVCKKTVRVIWQRRLCI